MEASVGTARSFRALIILVAGVALWGCGAARLPAEDARAIDELEQLADEGWLEAFRSGRCSQAWLHVGDGERSERELLAESPDALEASGDAIGDILAQAPERPAPSPECRAAVERFRFVRSRYAEAGGDALRDFDEAIARLNPGGPTSCPATDASLFGAELAVARHVSSFQFWGRVPFAATLRTCTIGTLEGPVALVRRGDEPEVEPASAPGVLAVQMFELLCTRGMPGMRDGCHDGWSGEWCAPSECRHPFLEFVSESPGTVTAIVSHLRAAQGCGSTGYRAYQVRREAGAWRVVNEEVIVRGHHGQ
ncbi:MAG: hypothetical protein AAF938_02165 [Myxococcota bacterium]